MATVSERAQAIVGTRNNKCWNDYCGGGSACPDCEVFKIALIEQALLAERRLAMEEALAICENEYEEQRNHCDDCAKSSSVAGLSVRIHEALRAAAEKEVGK